MILAEPMGAPAGRRVDEHDPFGNLLELLERDPSSPAAQRFAP